MRLIQLVPQLPPAINGLGDYAALLGERLQRTHGITSGYLVTAADWRAPDADRGHARALARPQSAALAEALVGLSQAGDRHPTSTVLLHYVNYAYQPRGCPFWLLHGLAQAKTRIPGLRLITMFHELYAFGPPWRSEFWLSPVQRWLMRQFMLLSERSVTNAPVYRQFMLDRRGADPARIDALPVFSNIGEPQSPPPFAGRRNELVVFGSAGSREKALVLSRAALVAICKQLGVTLIHDVGPRSPAIPATLDGIAVKSWGPLPAPEVSALLVGVRYGALYYWPSLLPKSGIFAAYASHGMVGICIERPGQLKDAAPAHGAAAILARQLPSLPPDGHARIAANALSWYRGHSQAAHAELFAGLIP